jgi:hypothetical protein
MTGAELIAEERQRQVEKEGWSANHDDGHDVGELAAAAVCYAMNPNQRTQKGSWSTKTVFYEMWPWSDRYWKPTPDDRVRELVKAGAPIAAEIDRLQRMK